MTGWSAADIPDQRGRTVVVTGANSGLGLATTRALTRAGARVVMACRDLARAEAAAATVEGDVRVRRLDLADLGSVRAFAAATDHPVDVLVNNAGLMAVPLRRTADGFELQFGTNHLGHFALTGLLLDRLTDRVVTVSSQAHRIGRIRLDDPNWERGRYRRWAAYGQSKLANLLFAFELEARLAAAGSGLRSVAAHPGYAATALQSRTETVQDLVMGVLNRVVAQPAGAGALPTLYAATSPDLPGGSYVGPDGPAEAFGAPRLVGASATTRDPGVRARLWALSESLTGVTFQVNADT